MTSKYQDLISYCSSLSCDPPDYLLQLERETHLSTIAPQMISGKLQGRFLSMISKLFKPSCILEIGTFTGYSALCLAEGLTADGQLHTIEANDEFAFLAKKYFERSPFSKQIHLHAGKAETLLPLPGIRPDLVYLDAGKKQYEEHFELVIGGMDKGGLILVDNVLWFGKTTNPGEDPAALAIHSFNQNRNRDARVKQLVLPVRDGISFLMKI